MAMTLQFVDWEYVRTDGVSGNILLDINDGVYYSMMLDAFAPRPAALRKKFVDSPLTQGLLYQPGISKTENIEIPLSIKCLSQVHVDSLLDEIRRDEIFLLYQETPTSVVKFYPCSPAPEIDTDAYWSRTFQDADIAVISFVLSASECYGEWEELPLDDGHLVGGTWEGAVGIVIPPSEIEGNLPAPCDIYLDVDYDSPPGSGFTNLILGQRGVYHPDYDPVQEPAVGTQVADAYRRSGDYRLLAAAVNLVNNGGFEDYTGSPPGSWGDPDTGIAFDHWTITRSGNVETWVTVQSAESVETPHSGDYCLRVWAGTGSFAGKGLKEKVLSEYINVDEAKPYIITYWAWNSGDEHAYLEVRPLYYTAGGVSLPAFAPYVYEGYYAPYQAWAQRHLWINPLNFPTGTDKIKLQFSFKWSGAKDYAIVLLDDVSLVEAAEGLFEASYPINSHQGNYLMSVAMSFADTTSDDTVTMQSMLQTSDGYNISPALTPQTVSLDNPEGEFREMALQASRLKSLSIPSHSIGDNVDKSLIEQYVRFTTSELNEEDVWVDAISLIPIDRAFIEISNWTGEHLILDSHIGRILTSLDGTLERAQIFDLTSTSGAPRFEADPAGMNFTLLAINDDEGDHQMAEAMLITLRYRPRYKL
jgi:hypothetical protein